MINVKNLLNILLITLSLSISTLAVAKPNLQPLGPNIADVKSQYYDFQIKKFQSQDQQRTYKVWIASPKNKSIEPPSVLYVLDGNAFMDRLKEPMLAQMAQENPIVLVAIGYDSDLPFVSTARSLDYTPADATGLIQPDPRNPERLSGGSTSFRTMLLEQIVPWVETQVAVDAQHRGIWGHSYGGLFVLDTLLQSDYFSHYFAASPSLTWADNRVLNTLLNSQIANAQQKQLLLMEGDVMVKSDAEMSPNFDQHTILNNRKVALHLDQQKLSSRLIVYPNLSHGEVFQAALLEVLLKQKF